MANKLAGQRAKFSRARALFYTSSEADQRQRAVRLMAEVLADAPDNGFTEDDVTQGEDIPTEVRLLAEEMKSHRAGSDRDEPDEEFEKELALSVDARNVTEIGHGDQSVYAYGYRCAPDRLKIGSCAGEVVARVAAQISTSTPDRPVLHLIFRTHDCRALEKTLHGIFRLKGKQVAGAGSEWFIATPDEVTDLYTKVVE